MRTTILERQVAWQGRRRVPLIAVALGLVACGPPQVQRGAYPTKRGKVAIKVAEAADGATTLHRSPSGEYLLAELAGAWRSQAFGDGVAVPPVFKLIHEPSGRVIARGNGWVLGPPTDEGDVVYVEEFSEEYRYRVRSLARPALIRDLGLPEGQIYVVEKGVRVGGRLVVLAYAGQGEHVRDFLLSIDPETLATAATVEMKTDLAIGGASASADLLLSLELPREGKPWAVVALDGRSLRVRWRTILPGTAGSLVGGRYSHLAALAASGDGQHGAVIYGENDPGGIDAMSVFVLDTKSGGLVRTLDPPSYQDAEVALVAGAAGHNAIALVYNRHTKKDGDRLSSVLLYDLADGRIIDELGVSRAALGDDWEETYRMRPMALHCNSALEIVLAPSDDYFGRGGLDASHVQGIVRTPRDWHQPDRPRVRERIEKWGVPAGLDAAPAGR